MTEQEVSLADLELAYETAARIVTRYGDAYLPTFRRLHEELEARRKSEDIKSIALRVATGQKQKLNSGRNCHTFCHTK